MQHPETALAAVDLVKTYKGGRGAPPVRALDRSEEHTSELQSHA